MGLGALSPMPPAWCNPQGAWLGWGCPGPTPNSTPRTGRAGTGSLASHRPGGRAGDPAQPRGALVRRGRYLGTPALPTPTAASAPAPRAQSRLLPGADTRQHPARVPCCPARAFSVCWSLRARLTLACFRTEVSRRPQGLHEQAASTPPPGTGNKHLWATPPGPPPAAGRWACSVGRAGGHGQWGGGRREHGLRECPEGTWSRRRHTGPAWRTSGSSYCLKAQPRARTREKPCPALGPWAAHQGDGDAWNRGPGRPAVRGAVRSTSPQHPWPLPSPNPRRTHDHEQHQPRDPQGPLCRWPVPTEDEPPARHPGPRGVTACLVGNRPGGPRP